jgi:hypothetical protein
MRKRIIPLKPFHMAVGAAIAAAAASPLGFLSSMIAAAVTMGVLVPLADWDAAPCSRGKAREQPDKGRLAAPPAPPSAVA